MAIRSLGYIRAGQHVRAAVNLVSDGRAHTLMQHTSHSRLMRRGAGAASLVVAAALLLSACGGGDSSSSDKADKSGKIAGADTGKDTASPAASDSAPGDGIKRPKVVLPKGVSNVFEGGKTGDPKQDAILADNARSLDAINAAITTDAKKLLPAVQFYNKGDALASALSYIQGFYDDGTSYVGTARYYNRKVTPLKGGAVAVTYCQDGSKTYPKDRKTGKVTHPPASADDYTFFNERMEKNDKGVWQSAAVISDSGSKKCA
ncbi:hypothetical protein [Streptomyces sp. NBC_00932]|uniref:hypothetical protein n=1 Tax=Streptomyces sp. NBC_00932 TaxID=2903690 RepID=UPI003867753F|nr:hypothetical protein OG221_15925 [Streptomyces sp. NBC_00932]